MALELKNAADRYELLKKEHKDSSADLNKALNATKEIRTELRGAREELQEAGKIAAGGSYLLRTKLLIRSTLPLMDAGARRTHTRTWRRVRLMLWSSSKIRMKRRWRSFFGHSSILPLARYR